MRWLQMSLRRSALAFCSVLALTEMTGNQLRFPDRMQCIRTRSHAMFTCYPGTETQVLDADGQAGCRRMVQRRVLESP